MGKIYYERGTGAWGDAESLVTVDQDDVDHVARDWFGEEAEFSELSDRDRADVVEEVVSREERRVAMVRQRNEEALMRLAERGDAWPAQRLGESREDWKTFAQHYGTKPELPVDVSVPTAEQEEALDEWSDRHFTVTVDPELAASENEEGLWYVEVSGISGTQILGPFDGTRAEAREAVQKELGATASITDMENRRG